MNRHPTAPAIFATIVAAACPVIAAGSSSPGILLDPSRAIDLTWPLGPETPYWPGGKYQPFHAEVIATLEADGVYSRSYCTPEHLGTHVDAPNHFAAGQPG